MNVTIFEISSLNDLNHYHCSSFKNNTNNVNYAYYVNNLRYVLLWSFAIILEFGTHCTVLKLRILFFFYVSHKQSLLLEDHT